MNDETMTTSTSSTPSALQDTIDADEGFEEDNLYPEESSSLNNRPHTPANDHLNAAAPGELSPPRPQATQPEDTTSTKQQLTTTSETMANGTATRSSARLANAQSKFSGASGAGETIAFPNLGGNERDNSDKPGWGWQSKKAQEEMQRAWDNIVDRDFSLREFGDVMLQGKAQMGGQ